MTVHPLKFYKMLETCLGLCEWDTVHIDMLFRRRAANPDYRSSHHIFEGIRGRIQLRIDTKSIFMFVQRQYDPLDAKSMETVGRVDIELKSNFVFGVEYQFVDGRSVDLIGQMLYCLLPESATQLAVLTMELSS